MFDQSIEEDKKVSIPVPTVRPHAAISAACNHYFRLEWTFIIGRRTEGVAGIKSCPLPGLGFEKKTKTKKSIYISLNHPYFR